jgi:predicted GTPase
MPEDLDKIIYELEEKLNHDRKLDKQRHNGVWSDTSQLKELKERIAFGDEHIKKGEGEPVLILGSTGAGKTTCANIFTKKQAMVEDVDSLTGPVYGYGRMQFSSDTTLPRKFFDQDNNILYWDTPGFFDDKGFAQDVANYFYIKKILALMW